LACDCMTRIVGRVCCIRKSSTIFPCALSTLKSTRTITRLLRKYDCAGKRNRIVCYTHTTIPFGMAVLNSQTLVIRLTYFVRKRNVLNHFACACLNRRRNSDIAAQPEFGIFHAIQHRHNRRIAYAN